MRSQSRLAQLGSGLPDAQFIEAGAKMIEDVNALWAQSEMIVKVKEPVEEEYGRIAEGQLLFTYFHLAAVPSLAPVLLEKKATAVAYETIALPDGRLPLLQPMSMVAGKMSVQIGANLLESHNGGKGVLLGGVPGTRRGRVVILGGGTVGTAAAKNCGWTRCQCHYSRCLDAANGVPRRYLWNTRQLKSF